MQVKDAMTATVMAAELGTSVRDVLAAMNEHSFRHVPVLDDGEVIGMVSKHDLEGVASFVEIFDLGREAYENYLNLPLAKVLKKRFLVARDVVVVDANDSLQSAVQLLIDNKFHSLPVIDGSRDNLVGILSYIDALRALSSHLDAS